MLRYFRAEAYYRTSQKKMEAKMVRTRENNQIEHILLHRAIDAIYRLQSEIFNVDHEMSLWLWMNSLFFI